WPRTPMNAGRDLRPTLRLRMAGIMLGAVVLTPLTRADETAAVKAIVARGGEAIRDVKAPSKPVVNVDSSNAKIPDVGVQELKQLNSLKALHLNGTRINDEALKELLQLEGLQELSLNGTPITDSGLKTLGKMKRLSCLTLIETKVTDAGMAELKVHKDMQIL